MFTLAVPGSPISRHVAPDAIVVGSQLDSVDELLAAGMRHVVLASCAESLRHSLLALRGLPVALVVDARVTTRALDDLRELTPLLSSATVLVRGQLPETLERELARSARALVQETSGIGPSAFARLVRCEVAA